MHSKKELAHWSIDVTPFISLYLVKINFESAVLAIQSTSPVAKGVPKCIPSGFTSKQHALVVWVINGLTCQL